MKYMQFLALAILFLASGSVFADESIGTTGDQFVALEQMFDAAPTATKADVMGWTTGRCYRYDNHTLPLPQLLVGAEKIVSQDDGPLFPEQTVTKVFALQANAPADHFDHLNPQQKANVAAAIEREFYSVSEMTEEGGSLVSECSANALQYQVRKSGEYLVVRMVVTRNNYDAYLFAGDTFAACYFFKKVN